ncbi:acyl-CoA N-acyltransferase [Pterulicium gracile]|uniref:Acyl-CoA N-acyltransferase n=1 Tax=Pterulicium gracile TaxID=1884261 RepID=A0A5C3QTF2_9AGAR|nr:acyl-CoA N-acyltransferase [Pterula gracilis]
MAPIPRNTDFHIRQASPQDVDTILLLIIELADYEKAKDQVQATPELLHRNIFEKQYAHALLAFSGSESAPGQAIGLALYFFNFSTWTGKPGLYLEDLYVSQASRSAGVGKALFAELGKVALEKDCARVDWAVLKWNQPSIDFYEKRLQAIPMSEWVGMRLEGEGINRLLKLVDA